MSEKEKELTLEILFKDGRSVTLSPLAGEAGKAIKNFESGASKIMIGTMGGGVEKAVFFTSEIRGIIPRWVEKE